MTSPTGVHIQKIPSVLTWKTSFIYSSLNTGVQRIFLKNIVEEYKNKWIRTIVEKFNVVASQLKMRFNLCSLIIFFLLLICMTRIDALSFFDWFRQKKRKAFERTPKHIKSSPLPEFINGKEGIEAELALLNLYFGFVDSDKKQDPVFKLLFIKYEKMKKGKFRFWIEFYSFVKATQCWMHIDQSQIEGIAIVSPPISHCKKIIQMKNKGEGELYEEYYLKLLTDDWNSFLRLRWAHSFFFKKKTTENNTGGAQLWK